MRCAANGRLAAALLASCAAFPLSAAPMPVEATALSDGSAIPAHSGLAGGLTEREAARRRAELLRSPYLQLSESRAALGGEAVVGAEAGVPPGVRDAAVRALERTVRDVLDRDGWQRPFAAGAPLSVFLVRLQPGTQVLLGWDGRDHGRLVRPVVAVAASGRPPEAVAFDVARAVSLLAVRQAGPDEAAWAADGLAELLAQDALGLSAPPVPASSPFLAPAGTLARPDAAALFLREATRRGTAGREALRVAWEEAGQQPGDDAEAFFRSAAGTVEGGAAGLLASLVADAVATTPTARIGSPGLVPPGLAHVASPEPLGWVRTTLTGLEERSGLEVQLPDTRVARGASAVLVYRPLTGEPDVLPLAPGGRQLLPLAGAEAVSLVLVDGVGGGELSARLRRVPGYPAVLSSSSAEWSDGAVHLGWRTSSHQGLLAWVVSRFRQDAEGALSLDGREVVPTTDASDEGSGFLLVDREAVRGARYLYRVAALTKEGLLSEAFEAAVEAD